MENCSFSINTKSMVCFGNQSRLELGQRLKAAGKKRVLCIYGKTIERTGRIHSILKSLEDKDITYFPFRDVQSDTPSSVVSACAEFARLKQVDAIVGIGGGSSIDMAKAVNALIHNTLPIETYFNHSAKQNPGVFLVAIPTTAGTGSEMTKGAVVYNEATGMKASISGPNCSVNLAIIDPSLTVGMPGVLTAGTGMDTLAHMLSPYLKYNPSPWTDMIVEKGIQILGTYLPGAIADPQNLECRTQLSYACLLAGTAMCDCPPHLEHAIGHALGVKFHIHHGIACALAIPYALQYLGALFPIRIIKIGTLLGFHIDPACSQTQQVQNIIEQFNAWNQQLGIGRLKDHADIHAVSPEELTETVMADMCFRSVPGNLSYEALLPLIKSLYE